MDKKRLDKDPKSQKDLKKALKSPQMTQNGPHHVPYFQHTKDEKYWKKPPKCPIKAQKRPQKDPKKTPKDLKKTQKGPKRPKKAQKGPKRPQKAQKGLKDPKRPTPSA